MKILLVSSYLPYPLFSGGHIRLFNLIKELSVRHKITLVCEKRDQQTKEDIEEVKKYCEHVFIFPRKKQWSVENIGKSIFSFSPFLVVGHTLHQMKQKIVSLLSDMSFDIIHIETFYVFQNVPKTYLPTVLVEHNIEYAVYERFNATIPVYLRPFLVFDINKIKKTEEAAWMRAKKVVAVSEKEKQVIEHAREDVWVVPNGVDLKSFKYQISNIKYQKREKRILFIGDFKWIQNQKSVEWILKEIWPEIEKKLTTQNGKVILWIVGKDIPQNLRSLGSASVVFDEDAPNDTAKIYQKSFLLLAPIHVGGGTSYKILESMASGTPVVTTPLGVEGLGAKVDKEALVGISATEIAQHVLSLLEKKELYTRIATQARELIEKKYSWKTIATELEAVYESTKS